MPPCCLELILLLEQGIGDEELMLRRELQKQAPIVIAVANSMSTQDSIPQLEGSSHSCIEVSLDEEFVFRVNLLLGVMHVVVEGLLYCSVSLLS